MLKDIHPTSRLTWKYNCIKKRSLFFYFAPWFLFFYQYLVKLFPTTCTYLIVPRLEWVAPGLTVRDWPLEGFLCIQSPATVTSHHNPEKEKFKYQETLLVQTNTTKN